MCFKLSADSLLLNYFYEKKNSDCVSLRVLQDTAHRIIERCKFSIIIDVSYGVVAETVRRYSNFITANNYDYQLSPTARNSDDFHFLVQFSRESMPHNVRSAMEKVLKE